MTDTVGLDGGWVSGGVFTGGCKYCTPFFLQQQTKNIYPINNSPISQYLIVKNQR
jgi:hypothetical protein